MIYIWHYLRRIQCVFGLHFWTGVLLDDVGSTIDYYYCMICNKEQKRSPWKDSK